MPIINLKHNGNISSQNVSSEKKCKYIFSGKIVNIIMEKTNERERQKK